MLTRYRSADPDRFLLQILALCASWLLAGLYVGAVYF